MIAVKNFLQVKSILSFIQDIWLIIGITILLIVTGHYLLGLIRGSSDGVIDARAGSPVYEKFPDKISFWKEHRKSFQTHFEPYYHWRRNSFVGEYTNVNQHGVRLTTNAGIRPGAKKIFMFGGSTMWGTGVTDRQTIPSILQARLGDTSEVYNFGEAAYVSTQELNYLLHQISLGNIPDVVIFYDGINDGYAGAYSPAVPRDPQSLRKRSEIDEKNWFTRIALEVYDKSNYKHLANYLMSNVFSIPKAREAWDDKIKKYIEKNSSLVLDTYEAHIRQVQAIAKEYEFRALFFWQPNLFSLTRKNHSYENHIIENRSPILAKSQKSVYEVAKNRLSNREGEDIYFLGNLFDEVRKPIYIDWMHAGPDGNELVAEEMFQHIRESL